MVKVVVDTSIIIDYLQQRSEYFLKLEEAKLSGRLELLIPYVVVVELFAGEDAKRKKTREAIELTLEDIVLVDLDRASAQKAGEIIRKYPQIPGPIDAIIAAIAMEHEAQIAAHNIKHFQQIRGLKLFDFSKKEITT